jgi:response regulator RpfG family c-di-GMP phosphodiesterase
MPKTLLIVEPEPLQHQLIDMLLAEDALDLVFASSGREALAFLKEATPDLALMSLDLPDITGAEICEKMKRVTRLARVPVVLVAPARDKRGIDAATQELARFVGADLLLQKPLGDKSLRDRLARLLLDTASREHRKPPVGHSTEILEDTLADIESDARRPALERENMKLRESVRELERRNEALLTELEQCREGRKRRGLFGRREP